MSYVENLCITVFNVCLKSKSFVFAGKAIWSHSTTNKTSVFSQSKKHYLKLNDYWLLLVANFY